MGTGGRIQWGIHTHITDLPNRVLFCVFLLSPVLMCHTQWGARLGSSVHNIFAKAWVLASVLTCDVRWLLRHRRGSGLISFLKFPQASCALCLRLRNLRSCGYVFKRMGRLDGGLITRFIFIYLRMAQPNRTSCNDGYILYQGHAIY